MAPNERTELPLQQDPMQARVEPKRGLGEAVDGTKKANVLVIGTEAGQVLLVDVTRVPWHGYVRWGNPRLRGEGGPDDGAGDVGLHHRRFSRHGNDTECQKHRPWQALAEHTT
jgi:hypothetical protein